MSQEVSKIPLKELSIHTDYSLYLIVEETGIGTKSFDIRFHVTNNLFCPEICVESIVRTSDKREFDSEGSKQFHLRDLGKILEKEETHLVITYDGENSIETSYMMVNLKNNGIISYHLSEPTRSFLC